MTQRMLTTSNPILQSKLYSSWCVRILFFLITVISGNVFADMGWHGPLGNTLGIHFNVPVGQPSTTISSASSTLWCNTTCTDPAQNNITNQGTGFSVGPGDYTYVCTINGPQCFPADNLQSICSGTGSIKIVNHYANTSTYTSECIPVTISSNTMVMITPSIQTMCTTTMAGLCT